MIYLARLLNTGSFVYQPKSPPVLTMENRRELRMLEDLYDMKQPLLRQDLLDSRDVLQASILCQPSRIALQAILGPLTKSALLHE